MAKILSKIASDIHQAQQMKEIQEFKELHDINVANATSQFGDPTAPVIEVCWGADCLFGSLYGVRELKMNHNGEQYWFHHEWGITEKADALHIARKLYADRGYNPLQFENKYIPDAVHGMMPVREKEETFP